MTKAYVLIANVGFTHDYNEYVEFVFTSRDLAIKACNALDDIYDILKETSPNEHTDEYDNHWEKAGFTAYYHTYYSVRTIEMY